MEWPDADQVEQIPAWVEEEFLQQIRAGASADIIPSFADRLPDLREQVTTYLQLLTFMELGQSAAESDSLIDHPRVIGGFQVEYLIGHGGMGTVYASRDADGLPVAIKRLHPERAEQITRFRREAETIARLDHPGIVRLHSFHGDDDPPFLVMELIRGIGLDVMLQAMPSYDGVADDAEQSRVMAARPGVDLLRAASFVAHDFATIRNIGEQVAAALAHTHALGIIHRDIKPANLIFGDDRQVRVTDFGLAKPSLAFDSVTQTGDLIGTPRYMAPEQMRGFADDRADIYSLGVTLWELCTGRCAWGVPQDNRPNGWELEPARSHNPQVPAPLSALIHQCCQTDPRRRPSAATLVRQLQRLRRHRSWNSPRFSLSAAVAVALLLIIAAAWSIATHSPSARPTAELPNANRPNANLPNANLPAVTAAAGSAQPPAPPLSPVTEVAITARSGQTSFSLSEILDAAAPERGLTARMTGGPHEHDFRIDLGSQLCVNDTGVCVAQAGQRVEVEMDVVATDRWNWAAIAGYGDDYADFVFGDGRNIANLRITDRLSALPISRSVGLASADGRTFYTTVPSSDGKVALWSLQLSEQLEVEFASCLNADCGLPSGTESLTTLDGTNFFAIGFATRTDYDSRKANTQQSRFLWQLEKTADGTFVEHARTPLRRSSAMFDHLALLPNGTFRIGWREAVEVSGWIRKDTDGLQTEVFGDCGPAWLALCAWSTAPDWAQAQRVRLVITPQDWMAYGALPKSRRRGVQRVVQLVNRSATPLNLFWVNFDGEKEYFDRCDAGSTHTITSYTGHVIHVHSGSELWDAFTVLEHMPPITIDGPRDHQLRARW